ncbi:MAG: sigma-70 family RNA polymerase sigma factor [Hyphomicrobiaceae bacterium]|nr:sigma-70 family RNA polymerase sigma factor [Hyphomicrobiaceae bacterium]
MKTSGDDLTVLLSRVANGDADAFTALYQATHLKLFGIALRILRRQEVAEEVLQEVYVRIWDRAADFTPGRASPITWMAVIARNRALDELRRQRPKYEDADTEIENVADAEASPAVQIETNEELKRLEECLGALGDDRGEAVRLAYLDGLSRKELATRLSIPVGTLKTWLHRSLKQLKDCLQS